MDLYPFLKSMADADRSEIVICNLKHEIIYMNPAAAERYAGYGGACLLGTSLLNCHNEDSCQKIIRVISYFKERPESDIVYTFHKERESEDVYMVALRNGEGELIGYYEKHERRKAETMPLYSCGL